MNNEDSIKKIKENLEEFWEELLQIQRDAKHYNTPDEYGKEGLSRWKNRLKVYISKNISISEAEEFINKKYPLSLLSRMDDPFKNFDN
ncbi:MAG: hypothetical protein GWO07_13240, partial [Candidatus Dadabacteria bacterium]|nr:hypothetical protein [Candidatus Dadabacteria bacterium]NIV40913.1 hypothetical protein [Candidatus Dadabacteria bacterium]NIX16163.1 hypothetical protein [Candidatus Dadabacteria bacterium]